MHSSLYPTLCKIRQISSMNKISCLPTCKSALKIVLNPSLTLAVYILFLHLKNCHLITVK